MQSIYWLSAVSGFLGGFGHCTAMCGPVVSAFCLTAKRFILLPHLLYHFGRVSTYVFVGAITGLIGEFASVSESLQFLQALIQLIAGLAMTILGLSIAQVIPALKGFEAYSGFFLRLAEVASQSGSSWRFFVMGLFLGLLPCGLSYSIFIASSASGSMVSGALIALIFGICTLPAMLLFAGILGYISSRIRAILYRLSGLVIVAMGGFYIYDAMHTLLD